MKSTRRSRLTKETLSPPPSLPPCLWRVMRLIWTHGPLTLAGVHRMSPALQITTVGELLKRLVTRGCLTTAPDERCPHTPGRPKRRYFPCVNYPVGLESIVQGFLADYLFGDPAGLSLLAQTVQQELSAAVDEALPAPDGANGRHLPGGLKAAPREERKKIEPKRTG